MNLTTIGAAAAAAALLAAAGCADYRTDRGASAPTVSPGSLAPAGTPTASPSAEGGSAGFPAVFAAARGREVVLVSTADGRVQRVVGRVGDDELVGATDLAPDGTVWYAVHSADAGGRIHRARPGEPPVRVTTGCHVALSRDASRLAVLGDERTCHDRVAVVDTGTGRVDEVRLEAADETLHDVAWIWDGAEALFGTALPEDAARLVRATPAAGDPRRGRRLGPPSGLPAGTGWYQPVPAGPHRSHVVESCCALDANSYEGARALLTLDDRTGEVVSRVALRRAVATLDADATGRHLLATDWDGGVWRGAADGTFERIADGLRAASW